MHPPPTPAALARPSVAHRRWRTHRVVLALAARLAGPSLWVSGTCHVRAGGVLTRPVVIASDADPPVDGVLDPGHIRLVVQFPQGLTPAEWRMAGADVAWRLHEDRVEIADRDGTRAVAAPCRLFAPVLARAMPWPLPTEAGGSPPGLDLSAG